LLNTLLIGNLIVSLEDSALLSFFALQFFFFDSVINFKLLDLSALIMPINE